MGAALEQDERQESERQCGAVNRMLPWRQHSSPTRPHINLSAAKSGASPDRHWPLTGTVSGTACLSSAIRCQHTRQRMHM